MNGSLAMYCCGSFHCNLVAIFYNTYINATVYSTLELRTSCAWDDGNQRTTNDCHNRNLC